jgi:hypothetical protein
MNEKSQERLRLFAAALAAAGEKTGGAEAACHHSAVEVNDWHAIQEAIKEAEAKRRTTPTATA